MNRIRSALWRHPLVLVACVAAVAAGVAVLAHRAGWDHMNRARSTASSTEAGPHVQLRDVDKKAGAKKVTLRTCPMAGTSPVGGNPWGLNCRTQELLDDGTAVTMQCWVSTYPPSDAPADKSAKWFRVTVAEGPFAGETGWVWSDLVAHQTDGKPKCPAIGDENVPISPQPLLDLHLSITGTCTTAGGTLHGVSSGFTPGGEYSVSAAYPDGRPYHLDRSGGRVKPDGSIAWDWPCAGDPAGRYTTTVTDLSTGGRTPTVSFVIGDSPAGAPTPSHPPTPTSTPRSPVRLKTEQSGSHGSPTFHDPHNASGQGPTIPPMTTVQVRCRVHAPGIASAQPDGWWYKIAGSPWNGEYYAIANTFWNGDVPGSMPYTHNTDWSVPVCP